MIVQPHNSNSIYIPLVQTGCCKSEFDSTYPIHLNGIIRQDEFQESINNINQAMSSKKSTIILSVIFAICIIAGIALWVSGGIIALKSEKNGFSVLIAVGFGIFILGSLILCIGCCVVRSRRTTQLYETVANESRKYSTRIPTPCSWRLSISNAWAGGYGHYRTRFLYQLIIDIGNSGAPGSGYMPYQSSQSVSYFPEKYNMPPPPYSDESASGFCSRCGAPRQNPASRFCLSCGQSFNSL